VAYENLLVDVRDGVGLVTVDREAKHNALDAFVEKRPARFAGR